MPRFKTFLYSVCTRYNDGFKEKFHQKKESTRKGSLQESIIMRGKVYCPPGLKKKKHATLKVKHYRS